MPYKLEFFDDRAELERREKEFRHAYLDRNRDFDEETRGLFRESPTPVFFNDGYSAPESHTIPGSIFPKAERMRRLFQDVESSRCWHSLTCVDGSYHPDHDRFEGGEHSREARRERALETFTEAELGEILNIGVNQGLLPPEIGWAPGHDLGHSLLYRDLVAKPGSLFEEAITPSFRRRLENGAFWEQLPGYLGNGAIVPRSYHPETFLEERGTPDSGFLGRGLLLFRRAWRTGGDPRPSMRMSSRSMLQYLEFLEEIEGRTKGAVLATVLDTRRDMLLLPFLRGLLTDDDSDGIPVLKGQWERIRGHAYLERRINGSPRIRRVLAEDFVYLGGAREMSWASSTDVGHLVRDFPAGETLAPLVEQLQREAA